jgi:hypothetical protein
VSKLSAELIAQGIVSKRRVSRRGTSFACSLGGRRSGIGRLAIRILARFAPPSLNIASRCSQLILRTARFPNQSINPMVSRTMLWVTIPKNGAGRATGELQLIFPCYDSLATLYLDLDAPEQAEHYMRKAQQICERAGIDPDALMVLPYLA